MIRKTGLLSLVLSPILGVILLPIILLVIVVNELARLIVSCILFVKYDNSIQLVTEGQDGYWIYKKKYSTRNAIAFLIAPEESFSKECITKSYQEQIQAVNNGKKLKTFKFRSNRNGLSRSYEKFEKIVTTRCGYSCWKKINNFNVSNHIRVLDKNKIYSTEDVQKCITQFGDDFNEDKPQWELIIVPKFDDGTGEMKSILFILFSHAYMDGMSLVMLVTERILTSSEYVIDPIRFKFPRWKKWILNISSCIYAPYFILVMNIERFFNKPWILRDNLKEPRTKFYTWANSKEMTFAMIRKIREHSGKASVTDVLSTAFSIAAKKTLPKERLVEELLITDLVAYLPYPDSRPQNRSAFYTFPISTKNEESSYIKLLQVKRDSLECMMGPDVLMSYYLFKIGGRLPNFVFPFFLHGSISSMLLSNVPFSKRNATLPTGAPLLSVGGFTPHPNDLGLSISTTRYGEGYQIFAAADSTWLSQEELSKLINQMVLEIIQMAEEAGYKKLLK